MPIAVKLSRRFYDAFGDEVVNELVEVLNQVDLAYRGTLHELNEANFSRLDERFARVDERFARFDEKLAHVEANLRAEMQAGFAKVDTKLADLRTEMQAMRGELVKWMFLFWAGTALTVIGLLKF